MKSPVRTLTAALRRLHREWEKNGIVDLSYSKAAEEILAALATDGFVVGVPGEVVPDPTISMGKPVTSTKIGSPANVCFVARRSLGLSQQALAKAAGIAPVTLSVYEAGEAKPHPRTRREIEDALRRLGAVIDRGGRSPPRSEESGVRYSDQDF